MKKIILCMTILLLLTGCYNYRELNDLAIASAVSIGKSDDGGFKIVVQVVNPKKDQDTSSSNEPDFITYKSEGKSLQEAFRFIVKESPKKIYGTQMQLLIIDEDLARDGLIDIIDFLARDPEIRTEFNVLIGRDKDILEILTPLDNISSQNIMESLIANNRYLGLSNLLTLNDLISDSQNNRIDLAIPSLKLVGNENEGDKEENLETTKSEAAVVLDNIGVFKKNKLLGYLTYEESLAYNLVMDNITTFLIRNDYGNDKYIVNEIIDSKTDINVIPKKNKVKIKIKGKSEIAEVNYTDINLKKEKDIRSVEKDMNKKVEKMVKKTIDDVIAKYDADIFGFEDLFYKEDYNYYKKIEKDWEKDIFKNLDVEVSSDFKVVEQGNLLGGIEHDK